MTTFQQSALVLILIWLGLVVVRFRRSYFVLVGGLVAVFIFTLGACAAGKVTLEELGLAWPTSWLVTIGAAILWSGLMFAYSPLADRLATRLIDKPPTLDVFRGIQQSRRSLIAGILIAWLLGGILEELVFRGVYLTSLQAFFSIWLSDLLATSLAVIIAAISAGLIHLYQGSRAAIIVGQLSVLFGILYVLTGGNLWAVILCHGFYDTVAFIRFANRKSHYSNLEQNQV